MSAITAGVVIPALNEEKSIALVVGELLAVRALCPEISLTHIVVVDNGSADGTAEQAEAAGAVVLSEPRKGYGFACKRGIEWHKGQETPPDILIFLDGDHADDVYDLPVLLRPLADGAELIIGSRLAGKPLPKGAMTVPQIFGNRLAVWLIRLLNGQHFTDLGPFRIIRREALERLDMRDDTYGWTVEMQLKAARLKLRCSEVPVRYRTRIGVSKVSGTVRGTIMAGYKILFTIFRHL